MGRLKSDIDPRLAADIVQEDEAYEEEIDLFLAMQDPKPKKEPKLTKSEQRLDKALKQQAKHHRHRKRKLITSG